MGAWLPLAKGAYDSIVTRLHTDDLEIRHHTPQAILLGLEGQVTVTGVM